MDGCLGFEPSGAVASRKHETVDRHIAQVAVFEGGGVEMRVCPIFALYTLAFTLQLRKNHGKSSVSIQLLRTKCKIFYLKIQFVPRSKHFISFIKPDQFMLYRT